MCIRDSICHKANPLHVFCRIKNLLLFIGLDCTSKRTARAITKWYEYNVFRAIIVNLLHIDMKGR